MHRFRLGLKIFASVVLSIAAIAMLLLAGLQTGLGKQWLTAAINDRMGSRLHLRQLAGHIPWDMTIGEVELRDPSGTWSYLHEVLVKLRPADLLHGRLTIAELGASQIAIERKPQSPPKQQAPSKPIHLPIPIDLQRLDAPSIRLAPPVLGAAMTMALTGHAAVSDATGSGRLTLTRTDGEPGQLDAAATVSGAPARLTVAVDASDPTGQVLNHLLSRADSLPLVVALHGDGPLADWHGHLDAEAGAVGQVTTEFTLSNRDGYHATIDGTVAAAGLLPAKIGPLIGNDAQVHLAARETPDGGISADAVDIRLASATITGVGRIGAGSNGPIAGRLHIAAPELTAASTWVGEPVAGRATVDLTASGTREAPSITVTVEGHGLRLADKGVETLAAHVVAEAEGRLEEPQTAIAFSGDGQVDGLTAGSAPAPSQAFGWHVSGTSTTNARHVDIREITVSGPALSLTGNGMADRDQQSVAATVHLAASDLAPFAAVVGKRVSGRAQLDGTISGSFSRPEVQATLAADDLRAGSARLDRVTARLHSARETNYWATAEAQFRSGGLDGTLDARATLSPDGKTLDLPRFHLAAGGTIIDAVLQAALDTHLTKGTIHARSADLAPLSGLIGTSLSGRFDMDARLLAEHGQEATVTLTGSKLALASGAGSQAATIDGITADARVSDLLGAPAGRGQLAILGARLGGASVQRLDASVRSRRPGDLAFTAAMRGQIKTPIAFTATGDAKVERNTVTSRIATFDGRLGDERLRLDQPLRVTNAGQDMSFAGLRLEFGTGRLDGSGSINQRVVMVRLAARSLPLRAAESFLGKGAIGGTVDGDIDVHGAVQQPDGTIALRAHGLRLAAAKHPGLAPIDIATEMRLRADRLALTGQVGGPKGKVIDLAGAIPVTFSAQPFSAAVPRDRPISLRLHGDGRMQDLTDLLPIGEDKISGHYHLGLTAGGTVAAPVVSGHVTVDHGRYESLRFGTVLDAISVDLEGDRDQIVLRQFTANDGAKGSLRVDGSLLPAAPGGPALNATMALQRFLLIHRDDATGHGSGTIQVAGPLLDPRVTARIKIDNAQVYLAERLPPNVRTVPVTVIDSRTGRVLSKPPPPSQAPPVAAVLDVKVDIPGQFFVRGRGLDSEWQGHFDVAGTSQAPDIRGTLRVVHGTMNFLGKTLDLTRGTITLAGGNKVEPLLDFVAESTSAQISAQVEVSGPADHPTIKLSSQPPLPQDEVLSQLLFGRDVTQLSPMEGLQIAQAAADLASGGPGVIDRIRMKFGLDRLSIGSAQEASATGQPSPATAQSNSNAGAGGSLSSTTVSAGKYVAPGVYVGVGESVSGQSTLDVEVELTRHLTVNGTENAEEGPGVGLSWRLDY